MPTDPNVEDLQFFLAACRLHEKPGTLEMDPETEVSRNDHGDNGAYVKCWVWVSNSDAERE